MSNNFDGPLLLDTLDLSNYFGFGRDPGGDQSTGPRILVFDADPNGVVTAPVGSLLLRYDDGTLWQNTNGAEAWAGGASASGITGDHAALENETPTSPANLQALADSLDLSYRRAGPAPGGLGATINVETTGSDVTGDGSAGAPFATIARALQLVGPLNQTDTTIALGAGTFALPAMLHSLSNVVFQGTTTQGADLNINAVVSASDALGIVLDMDGLAVGADELEGTPVVFTTGAAAGRTGWIYRNNATAGTTRVWVSQSGSSLAVPGAGDDIALITLDTELQLNDTTQTVACQNLDFNDINFTNGSGNRQWFAASTGTVNYLNCLLQFGRLTVVTGGRASVLTSYCANQSLGSGMLGSATRGALRLAGGTVIDGDLNGSANPFIRARNAGTLEWVDEVVLRGLNANGIQLEGADVVLGRGDVAHTVARFEDGSGAGSCDAGFEINLGSPRGTGGQYQLPNLHGTINGNFAVEGVACACIALGATSNVGTNTVANAVSADGASGASSAAVDGIQIFNGNPAIVGVPAPSYTVAGAPSATNVAGATIFVTDEVGGAVLAFSDGADWRRVTDRAVIS